MPTRFVITVALALLVASCSDDNSGTVTTTTTAAPTTTSEAPATTTSEAAATTTSEAATTTTTTLTNLGLVWSRIDTEVVFGGVGIQFITSVAAGGPGLVAGGGDFSAGVAAVWVSADGYTWTRIDDDDFGGAGLLGISSVAAGGPGLVAAGGELSDDADAAVWVSADGYTWTRIPHDEAVLGGPGDQGIISVTAGGPGLVAAGGDSSSGDWDGVVWVSADGHTWTRIDDDVFGGPGDQGITSVTAGGPGLVAGGGDSSSGDGDGVVWVSADGYTWTRIPHDEAVFGGPGDQEIISVTAGGPGLVAAGFDGSDGDWDAAVWVSADGYTWTRIAHDEAVFGGPGDQEIISVTAGGPGLVAGGSELSDVGWDAAVWVSADGYAWTRVPHDEAVFGGPDGEQEMKSVTALGSVLVGVGSDGASATAVGVWVSPPPG